MKLVASILICASLLFAPFLGISACADLWVAHSTVDALGVLSPNGSPISIGMNRKDVETILGASPDSVPYTAPNASKDQTLGDSLSPAEESKLLNFGSFFDLGINGFGCKLSYGSLTITYDNSILLDIMNEMYQAIDDKYGVDVKIMGFNRIIRKLEGDDLYDRLSEIEDVITPFCESAYAAYTNDITVVGIEIKSPEFRLFNGMYPGQSIDDYVTILNTGARMFYNDEAYYYRSDDGSFLLLDSSYVFDNLDALKSSKNLYSVHINTDTSKRYIESISIHLGWL